MTSTRTRRVTTGLTAAAIALGLGGALPGAAWAAPSSNRTTTSVAGGSPAPLAADVTTTTTIPPGSATSAPPSHPVCAPSVLGQARQRVETALGARVTQLQALLSAVTGTANKLTPADRQTLQNDISTTELPGIEALEPQVQQATTCAQVLAAAHSMVYDYRVFVVMTPQTHLTIVADDEAYVEGVLAGLEPAIAQAIQNAQARGKDVTGAQAAFADLQSKVTAAQGATTGQSSTVLAQTPSGYPGTWSVFLTARTHLTNAHDDLHAAYLDARQIRTDLL